MKKVSLLFLLSLICWNSVDGALSTCSVPLNSQLTDLSNPEDCALKVCGIHNSGSLPLERDVQLFDEISFVLQADGGQEEFELALTTARIPGQTPTQLFSMKIIWGSHDVYFDGVHYGPWSDSNSFPFGIGLEWEISIRLFRQNTIVINVVNDQSTVFVAEVTADVEGARDIYYHGKNAEVCNCIRLIGLVHRCNTLAPTRSPSESPTSSPTRYPSTSPTRYPSITPTDSPTRNPSTSPTRNPSTSPTRNPSRSPTKAPLNRCYTSCYEFDTEICQIAGTRRSNFNICGTHSDLDVAVLQMSQSNHMYAHCESACVYDINDIENRAWRWNDNGNCFDMVDGSDHECYVINNDDWHQVLYIRDRLCADCFNMVYDISNNPCEAAFDAQRKTILNCDTQQPDLNIYLAQANEFYPSCGDTCLYNYPDKTIYTLDTTTINNQQHDCYRPATENDVTQCDDERNIYYAGVHQASVCNYEQPDPIGFCQLLIYSSENFETLMSPPGAEGFAVGDYDCCTTFNDFQNDVLSSVRLIGDSRCRFKLNQAATGHIGDFWECTYHDGPGDYNLNTLVANGDCIKGVQQFQDNHVSHITVWLEQAESEKVISHAQQITQDQQITNQAQISSNGFKLAVLSFIFILIGAIMWFGIQRKNSKASKIDKLVDEYTPLMEMA